MNNKCEDCLGTIEPDCWCQDDNRWSKAMSIMAEPEYRAYYFGNMYLSSIQQGIQAAHVTSEFWNKYKQDTKGFDYLEVWSVDHKTMILLNGGYQSELEYIYDELGRLCSEFDFPFAKFHEEKESLNNALTSVGVILPEEVYGFDKVDKDDIVVRESDYDADPSAFKLSDKHILLSDQDYVYWEIRTLLSKYRMAN